MNHAELKFSELIIFIVAGISFFLLLSGFIIYFILLYVKRQKQFEMEQKIMEATYKQALMQSKMEIREQTMQQIARELHDNLGQIASLIKINLNTLPGNLPAEVHNKIDQTKELSRQLISDIKGLSQSLNQQFLQRLGLAKSLEIEILRISKMGIFKINFEKRGDECALEQEKEIFIYRMSQEILNNILKHSEATLVMVRMIVEKNELLLEFEDNGKGFDLKMLNTNFSEHHGSGLFNLTERSKLIGSELVIDSSPGKGTRTSIRLNLN